MFLLGTITCLTTVTRDNGNTAVPFTIPAGTRKLRLQSDTAAVFGGFVAASATALATAAGFKIPAADTPFDIELDPINAVRFLAINNPTGGTSNVKVFRVK
jgi:hypothetical protein